LDNNVSFTFNYPQGYAGLGIWYVTFVLDWYDETTGRAKSVTWNFYNTGHYYLALLPSRFDINPRLGIIKRSKANFISSFQFKKSVQTSANFLDVFALRGFIELRLMKRSSAQLATPVTFTANAQLRNMVRTPSNLTSNFALIESETQSRIRKPPARLITPVTFRANDSVTRRVSPNLISRSLIANPRSFRTRRTVSNQTTTATLYNNNYRNEVWDLVGTQNFTGLKAVTSSQNNVYYLRSDGGVSVYTWAGNYVGAANPQVYVNGSNLVNFNFESIRASDDVLFAFARNVSVPFTSGVNDYLIKYVRDQYGNYVANSVIVMDADGLATHDVALNGNFAYVIRASRMQSGQSGYRVITNNNYVSSVSSSNRIHGISISGNWLHLIIGGVTSSIGRLTYQKYLLSNGYYGLQTTTQLDTVYDDTAFASSVANNATGGWYSYNDQLFGLGRVYTQSILNNGPYGIYNPYNASSTLPWTGQALNKYATNNLALVADANNTVSVYTNLNNTIVDAKPNANATEWPNRFSLSHSLTFNPDYVVASPDGNYLLYASTTQAITFKKR
jgi:hypothetical protein